ncbi:MAG: hypothetical protein ACE5I1_04815 [bacterium]
MRKFICFFGVLVLPLTGFAQVRLEGGGGGNTIQTIQDSTGWTKTGTNVHLTAGTDSVGIGTASPNNLLHLSADLGTAIDYWMLLENTEPGYIDWRIGHNADNLVFFDGDNSGNPTFQRFTLINSGGATLNGSSTASGLKINAGTTSSEYILNGEDWNGNTVLFVRSDGNVGIGATPATSGILDITSTTGALIVSRMTTTQRDAMTAVNGMIIYNTTTNAFNFYENGVWVIK